MKIVKSITPAFLILVVVVCLFSRCKPGGSNPAVSASYSMKFALNASGTPVKIDQTITTGATTRYYLDQLRFYAGLPRLVKTDNSEVSLANVFIVKFDNGIPDNAICGTTFSFNVPSGSYKAIRFGVGMPHTIKDTVKHYHFGPLDPLNADYGMLWQMTMSTFRNIAISMYADTSKAQNLTPTRFLSFHILEDRDTLNLYKELEFPINYTAGSGTSISSTFNLDINQVFFNATNPINLKTVGSTDMTLTDKNGIATGIKIFNNFVNAITIQR